MQLNTNVAIGHKIGRHRPFVEDDIAVGDQLFEADGRLEFAGHDLELGAVIVIDQGVKNGGSGRREVGHEHEVEVVVQRSLHDGPRPAQEESIVAGDSRAVQIRPRIHLHQAAQFQEEILVG